MSRAKVRGKMRASLMALLSDGSFHVPPPSHVPPTVRMSKKSVDTRAKKPAFELIGLIHSYRLGLFRAKLFLFVEGPCLEKKWRCAAAAL